MGEFAHIRRVRRQLKHEERLVEARAAIERDGLVNHVSTRPFDVNRTEIEEPVDLFMANHSLHHIVELERLFDQIIAALVPNGYFVTCDMIGRNGHMRWPETRKHVEAIWSILHETKKYNWQHRQVHHDFVNYDCSSFGFEGIRAQDILPLLVQRFDFESFLGCGGFVDPFVDRGYGPNYDPENPADCAFIDVLAKANDAMLETGEIKPTMIFAHGQKGDAGATNPHLWRPIACDEPSCSGLLVDRI